VNRAELRDPDLAAAADRPGSRPGSTATGAAARRPVDAALAARIAARAAALEALYREIAATRMADIPILHPGLRVATVGFEADDDGAGAHGVLVTPWFMNLIWFPVEPPVADTAEPAARAPASMPSSTPASALASTPASPAGWPTLALGASRERSVGNTRFPFIGSGEAPFGPFEACSLFSPMFEFEDQPAAVATAQAVLQALRRPAPEAGHAEAAPPREATAPEAPARRGFLFGSGAAGGGGGSAGRGATGQAGLVRG
jgi:[NiFe] hydrogenase assembly HybE family chaperone